MPSTSGEYNASNQVPFGSAATDQTAPAGAAATHRQTGKTAIAVLVVAVIVLALFITSTVSRQMQAAEDRAEQESTQSVEVTKSSEQAKSTAQAESTAQSDLNADLSLDGIQGSYWSNAKKILKSRGASLNGMVVLTDDGKDPLVDSNWTVDSIEKASDGHLEVHLSHIEDYGKKADNLIEGVGGATRGMYDNLKGKAMNLRNNN